MSNKVGITKEEKEAFKSKLRELGYKSTTICTYANGAEQYMATGNALDSETVTNYWNTNFGKRMNMQRLGTLAYIRFIQGIPIKDTHEPLFKGCDEDCFNCPYPDCYRPENMLHGDPFNLRELLGIDNMN